MTIDSNLLDILACPENKTPVALAAGELIERLNLKIASGEIIERSGATVTEPLEAGLIRADGKVLYPIRDDIPVMLIEHGIEL